MARRITWTLGIGDGTEFQASRLVSASVLRPKGGWRTSTREKDQCGCSSVSKLEQIGGWPEVFNEAT